MSFMEDFIRDPAGTMARVRAACERVQAEADRRIAEHPDLADLDDQLDDIAEGRVE